MVRLPKEILVRTKGLETNSGQAILEFALVLPLLVLFIVGIFDLGYAVFTNNMLENAARAGARAGIIMSNGDDVIRARVRAAAPTLNLPNDQITISPSPTRTFDEPITVTVRYAYRPFTPGIAQIIPGGMQLSATSVMIVEGAIRIPP